MATVQEINDQRKLDHEARLALWRAREKAAIWEVAYLTMNINPNDRSPNEEKRPPSYDDLMGLLISAVMDGAIPCEKDGSDERQNMRVRLADVDAFLAQKHISGPFFDGSIMAAEQRAEPYLDPDHPCYAPKLAAAVAAWTAVTAEENRAIGTPKQRMETWLKKNAANFGLLKPDGKVNEQGISDISKVANWKPEGGAAKTPVPQNTPSSKK